MRVWDNVTHTCPADCQIAWQHEHHAQILALPTEIRAGTLCRDAFGLTYTTYEECTYLGPSPCRHTT